MFPTGGTSTPVAVPLGFAIARLHGFPGFRSRFKADVAEALIGGERVLLLKPQTYMNASGEAVGEAARFFKIPLSDIVVIHDDIDLRPGKMRVKCGGNAGHNGLRSIDAFRGADYWRGRIGVVTRGSKSSCNPTCCRISPMRSGLGRAASRRNRGNDPAP